MSDGEDIKELEQTECSPPVLKNTLTNPRNWIAVIGLFIITLVIYSDLFISDFLAKIFPKSVQTDTGVEYQTKASGALIQGLLLVIAFVIFYLILISI